VNNKLHGNRIPSAHSLHSRFLVRIVLLAIPLCAAVAFHALSLGNNTASYIASNDATFIAIEDDFFVANGDQIRSDSGVSPVSLLNIETLNLFSGDGDETINLYPLDANTSLRTINLSGDTEIPGDTGNDVFLITASAVAEVYVSGGAGEDWLTMHAYSETMTVTKSAVQRTGVQDVTFHGIERIHLVGADGDDDWFRVTPSTFAVIDVNGGAGFDTLTVVAPEHLVVDSGTYIDVCNHERIYYTDIEEVMLRAPDLDTLSYTAGDGSKITISDVPATLFTEQIEQFGQPTVTLIDIDELIVTCHSTGNTVEVLALDACSWMAVIALIGQGGPDAFEVTAQLGAEVDVQGGAGVDTLTVDALGNAAVDKGTHIEIAGYQDVTYSDIETVILINVAPSASIEVQGNGNAITHGDQTPSTSDYTNFGDVPVGKSFSRTFVIRSLNAVPLEITGVSLVVSAGSTDFSVSVQPSALPLNQGDTTTFIVRCTPADTGSKVATVSIASNDAFKTPFQFDIRCDGTQAPEIRVIGNNQDIENGDTSPSVADHTEFGYLEQVPISRTFRIGNSGTEELHLYSNPTYVTIDHPQFTISQQPAQAIAVDGSTPFAVTVVPGPEANPSATVTIWNTDYDEDPFTFQVHAGGSEEETGPWPDAGPDQTVVIGERVILDGSGSRDSQVASASSQTGINPMTITSYRWEFAVGPTATGSSGLMIPTGSQCWASSQGFDQSIASFIADVEGSYTLELHVTNEQGVTMMDQVVVTAIAEAIPAGEFHVDRFVCAPNPFSTSVTFRFEGTGIPDFMEVSVYSLSRALVWKSSVSNAATIHWDGRTTSGVPLPSGGYIYLLRAVGNGQRFAEQAIVFILR
jgi:hypothetical protein